MFNFENTFIQPVKHKEDGLILPSKALPATPIKEPLHPSLKDLYALARETDAEFLAQQEKSNLRLAQEEVILPEEVLRLRQEVSEHLQQLEENRVGLRIITKVKKPSQILEDLKSISPKDGVKIPVPEDVSSMVKSIATALAGDVHFGPIYTIDSPNGKVIVKDVFYSDTDQATYQTRLNHILVASGEDGQVLGLRGAHFDKDVFNTLIHGKIVSLSRGRGAASAIDTAFVHLVQRLSDADSGKMTWQAHNENLKNLKTIQQGEINAETIKTKEEEQQRWLSLYGESGKFGLKLDHQAKTDLEQDAYHRQFSPLVSYQESVYDVGSDSPQERLKAKLERQILRNKEPANLAEVDLRWTAEGIEAQEVALPDDLELRQSRAEILKQQLKIILEQLLFEKSA